MINLKNNNKNMKNLKNRESYFNDGVDNNDLMQVKGDLNPLKHEKRIPLSEVKEIAYSVWKHLKKQSVDTPEKLIRKSFEIWWENQYLNENILPRPYKKIKCLECGEEVCDNMNYKIGHLYNKHNCKPSLNDYKAIKMMKSYFA